MSHTVDMAKKLWCPHVTASHTDPRHRTKDDLFGHNCIGPLCSQWRWDAVLVAEVEPNQRMEFHSVDDRMPDTDDPDLKWVLQSNTNSPEKYWALMRKLPRAGYCGLAGKP